MAQVFGADLGQPGQASRRASELHQGGDALAVGHLGGPQQHPAHSQDPQPGPGGAEADIYYNAIADDGMACHGTQSTGRAPGFAAGAGPYPCRPKVTSAMAGIPGTRQRSKETR